MTESVPPDDALECVIAIINAVTGSSLLYVTERSTVGDTLDVDSDVSSCQIRKLNAALSRIDIRPSTRIYDLARTV